VEHSVSSTDADYDGLYVEGVAVNVLDDDGDLGAYINVYETEAVHVISEDGSDSLSFWVYPTVVPDTKVTVQAASQTDSDGNPILLLNGSSLTAYELVFDGSTEPQYVTATYNPDTLTMNVTDYILMIEFDLVTEDSTDERFENTGQTIRPIYVKVIPSINSVNAKAVTVVEPLGYTMVAEGTNGFDATYDVYLRPCTTAMMDSTTLTIAPTVDGKVTVTPDSIEGSDWNSADDSNEETSLILFGLILLTFSTLTPSSLLVVSRLILYIRKK